MKPSHESPTETIVISGKKEPIQQILLNDSNFSGSEFRNGYAERVSFQMVALPKLSFQCADLHGARFNDINFSGTRINDANLSDLEICNAQLGGAYIHNIGLPPEGHPAYEEGKSQRPLRFENCDLNGSTLSDCRLDGVSVRGCSMKDMTIDGIPVEQLLAAYRQARGGSGIE
ncbi:pentapeptide repeat-containing protein [Paenibacillus doosanensis]|uniref:pentapeptide repeat-containing protein n=1 Tax=Paenibacillus doosanensis TaxID=1229154 RepID=UPI00218005F7|nr:pentapeptide repeat-containing protein [Paenibacillus doosanensis]MCS7458930.1 pentapeptide repeat-containing protein [Paenibacillus doosanensis]